MFSGVVRLKAISFSRFRVEGRACRVWGFRVSGLRREGGRFRSLGGGGGGGLIWGVTFVKPLNPKPFGVVGSEVALHEHTS